MLRLLTLCAILTAAPLGARGQALLGGEGIAGLGAQGCGSVAGAGNAPVLAGAVDWGLGYLAGRRDAGHAPVEGEPLSATDAADVAVGIVLYCRENPSALVIDALRAYGRRVYGEGPADIPSRGQRPPRRPPPRPRDGPPADVLAAIEAARRDAEVARWEAAAAAGVLSVMAGPAGLAARMAAGSVPGPPPAGAVVSRGASDLGPPAVGPVGAAPAVSPRPPWRAAAPVRRTGPL